MGNIVLLDDLTINKIAAGEVVERPASVVKELVENSIDAGATNISVEIRNGGISYIRITDNGKGIAQDDMEIAFERHATSKIRKAEDLDVVKSMGFRGEALASVAAIANVELISKQQNDEIGNRIVVEAGNVIDKEEIGCPVGTTITVKNLFFNTPVRYKFLKKDYTEAGYIEDVITRLALINPDIAFKLVNSGKVIVKTYGDGNLNNVIYSIFGKDIANATVDTEYEYEGIKVKGVVGKPEIARSNRTNQIFFVNKRYVKDKTLAGATEQAYKGLLTVGKYGFLVLNVEMDPSKVDVNVHPAKLEVRFADENTVFKAVYHAIKEALSRTELVENVVKEKEEENIENGLTILEEKKMFGKFFKNKKKKEDWEVAEKNLVEDIYNKNSEENKNEDYKEESDYPQKTSTINEAKEDYETVNTASINDIKLNINANVFDKIEMLQKQVLEDLNNNPNIVFDRKKLEDEKRKLEELRNLEKDRVEIESIIEVDEKEEEKNVEKNISEDINKEEKNDEEANKEILEEKEESTVEIKIDDKKVDEEDIEEDIKEDVKVEENVNSSEVLKDKEDEEDKEEIAEEVDKLEEESIENVKSVESLQDSEKEEDIAEEEEEKNYVANNQILQSSEDDVDRILKKALAKKFDSEYTEELDDSNEEESKIQNENKNNTEDPEFDEMYDKIFGRKKKIVQTEDDKENSADDIVTVEEELEKTPFTPYETIKNNNFSVFEEKKTYKAPSYKFIGIAFSTYIIIEIKQELYIIDQHAAHERIMYEKVKRNFYSDGEKDSQMLLLPDIINLTHKEMDIVRDNWNVFEKAGFELDYFGENTIKLTGVPDICFDLDTKALFLETLDEINTVARTAKQEIEEKFIATIACKAAVKANMALNDEEVHALLEELLKLPNPFTCPHGRPTAIKMNKFDLEKKFSRRK